MLRRRKRRHPSREIEPDEIFLDSKNLPAFDRHQLEGRLGRPISRLSVIALGAAFAIFALLFLGRAWALQVFDTELYSKRSENNRLRHAVLFPERGVIYDRRGELLASNVPDDSHPEFAARRYSGRAGLAHVLGFVKYPSKDANGFYYKKDFEGVDGVEKFYDELLAGESGLRIVETDVLGAVQSESVVVPPRDGKSLSLSIDARLSEALYDFIKDRASGGLFQGGAAILMDIRSGEVLAETSYPEYSPAVLSEGKDAAEISRFLNDPRTPFLNRVTDGLYTPGSIVKPFLALGALREGIATSSTTIVSTGSISIPNPYDPAKRSVFMDWKAHGAVDMPHALAVSSNVYFYEIGGGFGSQKGLGIGGIEKYLRLFGFGEAAPDPFFARALGVIPNPAWKADHFSDSLWRIGDTYNTAIGQYGVQVTPMQAVRAVAAIANGGTLVEPTIVKSDDAQPVRELGFAPAALATVKEGMRLAVLLGTAHGLDIPQVSVAAKTGTAEVGTAKRYVNSWAIGFFPYEHPRFAFAAIMERGPRENTVGALYVIRQFLEWLFVNAPEYLSGSSSASD